MSVCTQISDRGVRLGHDGCSFCVAYIPGSFGHYVENTGNSTLHYLEIFNTDTFQDVSLSQVRTPALVPA